MVGWACLPEAPCTWWLTVFSLSITTMHAGIPVPSFRAPALRIARICCAARIGSVLRLAFGPVIGPVRLALRRLSGGYPAIDPVLRMVLGYPGRRNRQPYRPRRTGSVGRARRTQPREEVVPKLRNDDCQRGRARSKGSGPTALDEFGRSRRRTPEAGIGPTVLDQFACAAGRTAPKELQSGSGCAVDSRVTFPASLVAPSRSP